MVKSLKEKQKELLIKIVKDNHIVPELNLLTLNLKSVNPDSFAKFVNKKDYNTFIGFLYELNINNTEKKFKERSSNIDHDGSETTMKTTKNGDMEIYFMKRFNYKDLEVDQKKDLNDYLTFLDSIWDMREKVYKKFELAKESKLKKGKSDTDKDIIRYNAILKNRENEDRDREWKKIEKKEYNFDTIYRIDNLLRHGIIDELGWMSKDKYGNVKTLLEMRKEQLIKMKECLENEKKDLTGENLRNTEIYIQFLGKEIQTMEKIKEMKSVTDGEFVQKTCNLIKYGIDEKIYHHTDKRIKNIKSKLKSYETIDDVEYDEIYINKKELNLYIKTSPIEQVDIIKIPNNLKEKIKSKDIDILYDFIDPEKKYNHLDEIPYNKRQFIYGFLENINFYKNFPEYFNINPWKGNQSENCYQNLIRYSLLLNKLNVFCISQLDIPFPLRYIFNKPYVIREEGKEGGRKCIFKVVNGKARKLCFDINNKFLQQIQVSYNPSRIYENKIIGYVKIKGTNISFIILLNDKKERHRYIGKYSYFSMTNMRLEQMDINNITPTQNISWDEFNIMYHYLKKPIYIYNPDPSKYKSIYDILLKEDDINTTYNLFVHNENYTIPEVLKEKLIRITDENYESLNLHIKYEDYVQNKLYESKIDKIIPIDTKGGFYYDKYMKYKSKYLQLKKNLNIF